MTTHARKSMSSPHRALNFTPTQLKAAPRDRAMNTDRRLVERVRGEFVEMRGFSPTLVQAIRLFDLPEAECEAVLMALVAEGFLLRSTDGRYRVSRHR